MSETPLVSETLHGPVAVWTLNRPQQLNALNGALIAELGEKVDAVQQRDDVRCVVLTGSGEKAFVAGADIKEFSDFDGVQGRASPNGVSGPSSTPFRSRGPRSSPPSAALPSVVASSSPWPATSGWRPTRPGWAYRK